jgi:hypothetical protein
MKKILLILLILIVFLSSCSQEIQQETPPETIEQPVQEETAPEPVEEQVQEEQELEQEIIEEEPVEETLDPSLIAYWKFDDDVEDSVGDHDGTIIGGAVFKQGKVGQAIYLDGVDDYVDFPLGEIDDLSKGTISFWFNYESLLDKQIVMPIFYFGGDERDEDNIFIIEIGHFDETSYNEIKTDPNNKKLYVTWIKNNQEPFLCFDSNMNLEENKWHHFAVVVDSDGNTGYLNGIEMDNRHYNFGNSNNPSFLDDISGKTKFMLGYGRSSYMISSDFVYYKGYVDDLRVYNKALSSDEVKELV